MTPFVVEVRPARHHFPFSATINNLSRVTFPEEIIMKLRLVSPLAAALGLAWTSSVLLLLASPTTDAAKISKFGHLHKRRAGSFEKDGVRDGRYAVNDHDFRGRRLNIFEHCPTVKTAKSSKSTTPTLCQCVACCEGFFDTGHGKGSLLADNECDTQCPPEDCPELRGMLCTPSAVPSSAPSLSPQPSPSTGRSTLNKTSKSGKGGGADYVPGDILDLFCAESEVPSQIPSQSPSLSFQPSEVPSSEPSARPLAVPSALPSLDPSESPSFVPSTPPSDEPSLEPSLSNSPSEIPSSAPSQMPSGAPSTSPSCNKESKSCKSAKSAKRARNLRRSPMRASKSI